MTDIPLQKETLSSQKTNIEAVGEGGRGDEGGVAFRKGIKIDWKKCDDGNQGKG